MIVYLTILFLLLLCIFIYDIRGVSQFREFNVILIVLILTLVSGLSYRLGGDGVVYMEEYSLYGSISDLSISYLRSFNGRMPGWVLLCTLCKTFTSSYWFFKLVHAIILNVAYVKVIKSTANYVFTGILFYFILLYFNQNFQVLREALAISCFFYSIPYYNSGKWAPYYLFALLAISFHEGAIFLLLLPFIKIMGVNRYTIPLYLIAGILFIYFASFILEFLIGIYIDGEIQGKIQSYTSGMDSQYSFSYWSNILLNILLPFFILYYYYKRDIRISYFYPVIFGLFIYILSLVVPIAYRLNNYCLIFNYILIADFVFYLTMNLKVNSQVRIAITYFFLIVFLSFKGRMYFLNYGDTQYPSYVQYYPYASVIEKYEDPTRERFHKEF